MERCTRCGSDDIHSTAQLVRVTDECQDCGHMESDL